MPTQTEEEGLKLVPMVIIGIVGFIFVAFVLGARVSDVAKDVTDTMLLVRFDEEALVITTTEDVMLNNIKVSITLENGQSEEAVLPEQKLEAYDFYTYSYPEDDVDYVIVYYNAPTNRGRAWRPIYMNSYAGPGST